MNNLKLIVLLLVAISFSGCKKLQEKWIVGEWIVEDLARDDDMTYWVFNEDNTVVIINDSQMWAAASDTIEGVYAIKSQVGNYVEIRNIDPVMMDGKWFIEKMNSELLILTRREFLSGEKAGAYLRRELYK